MNPTTRIRWLVLIVSLSLAPALSLEASSTTGHSKKKESSPTTTPVLWHDPGVISQRDLYYGPGSRELAPKPPFRFLKEDVEGGVPQFDIQDARGTRWKVKVGPEAQAETVATRLVWAVGYNAEESYYFNRVHIDGLRPLSSGRQYVVGESVRAARFEPYRNVEPGEHWDWLKNPFKNTRELDGLKTMMVLLNNWKVFKNNNRVLRVKYASGSKADELYTVTNLDATLGSAGAFGGRRRSKNNLQDFQRYRMVHKVEYGKAKFDYDIRPKGVGLATVAYPPYLIRQWRANSFFREVPIKHALWIGSQLAQLSDDQLRDCFRAAGYDRATTEGYVRALRRRINELNQANLSKVGSPRRVASQHGRPVHK